MIGIFHEWVHDIPVLHIVKGTKKDEQLPTVIFIHGFTSAKEHNLHYAYYFAEKGFRVLLPEAKFHGERAEEVPYETFLLSFWEIVIQNIQDVQTIKEYYEEKGYIDPNRIGVAGTSMGAITTLGALTQYDWIKAAVSLMGAPAYVALAEAQVDAMKHHYADHFDKIDIDDRLERLKKYDLSIQMDALQKRPLLFWHGKQDTVVPFQNAYIFYEEAKSHYGGDIDRLQFIADEKAGHKVSRQGVLQTVAWFERFL